MIIFAFTKAIITKAQHIPNHFNARYKFHISRYEDLNFLTKQPSITFGTTFNLMKKHGYILDGGLFNEKLRLMQDFTQQKVIIQKDANVALAKSLAAIIISIATASVAILLTAFVLPIILLTDIIYSGLKVCKFYCNSQHGNREFPAVTSGSDNNLRDVSFRIGDKKPFIFTPKPRRTYKSFSSTLSKSPSINEDAEENYDASINNLCIKLKTSTDEVASLIKNTTRIRL